MENGYKFVMIDGLDGIGKGVISGAIVNHLRNKGLNVLDITEFWEKNNFHPEFEDKNSKYYLDISEYDAILSAEPTFCGIGKTIREEIISKNSREYNARFTASTYAADRMILYNRIIKPALKQGKIVIQSRGLPSSLVYQSTQGENENLEPNWILNLKGNLVAMETPPSLLIIPTINNPEEVMERLSKRDKKDYCTFENLDFQVKIKPLYESNWLREIFENAGTKVKYLDAGISVENSQKQAINLFDEAIKL